MIFNAEIRWLRETLGRTVSAKILDRSEVINKLWTIRIGSANAEKHAKSQFFGFDLISDAVGEHSGNGQVNFKPGFRIKPSGSSDWALGLDLIFAEIFGG